MSMSNVLDTAEYLRQNSWKLSPARMAEYLEAGKYTIFPYVKMMDDLVAKSVIAGNARIIVSMPPRHGKSTYCSKSLPAWYLSQYPSKNVILASYEQTFAAHWGKQVRNYVQEHKQLGITLADDSLAADRWSTVEGGGMFCTGIGGPVTGRGAQLIVVDDPVKNWEEARSEVIRQNHIDWFNSTLFTRCEPNASIIVLMTRWHENDLAGYLLTEQPETWTELRLPAFAEAHDALHRPLGAALCPQRFDERALAQIQRNVGPNVWASLYQQRPSPLEGDLFKRDMFVLGSMQPDFDYTFVTCDTSYTDKTTNDFTVAIAFGVKENQLFIRDVFRQRIKAADVEIPLTAFIRRYAQYGFRGVYIEPKGHGMYLNQVLPRQGIVVPSESQIKDFYSDRKSDKVIRANNALPYLSLAKIIVNDRIPDVDILIAEALSFPRGKHDDFVDALIDGVKYWGMQMTSRFSICDVIGEDPYAKYLRESR